MATTSGSKFQTYKLIVCREKKTTIACMNESKKGKGGKE
jgi:hypothetical protein